MNPILAAVMAAGAGAGGAWLWLRAASASQRERLLARERELERAREDAEEARARNEALGRENSELRAELAAEKAAAEARLEELRNAHERLKADFSAIAAKTLRSSQEDFLKLAEQNFARLQEASASDLGTRQTAIATLVQPLREALAKVDEKIADLERNRATAYGQLGQQLETLQSAQLRLQGETGRLASVLSTTRTAGTWGEVQLRRVVELSGLTEHVDFEEQVTPGSGERDRADLVVYLPQGQRIIVDAKAPSEAFREAAVEPDPVKRAARLADHAAKVRGHCDALSSREYWDKFKPSPEFVVLFLPGDQFLAAALEADPSIMDRAVSKKVLLATPTTLIALLKAAAYGWRQEAVSRNAEEISQLGRQLHERLCTFTGHLEKLGKSIQASNTSYNEALGSLERSVLPGARKFEELGAKSAKELKAPPFVEAGK